MTSQPPSENTASTAQRVGWAILIAATLYFCYFSHLGVIGFVGPDEPRYAWIARDMAETGDWVTPRLYGKPWFEKPPLYYWGGAICFKLFGVSEAAARLPSAISALLATLAMAWLAWRIYGSETARWLLLLLPTTVGMIGFSHAAATDMPFSAMLTIAMVCAAVVVGLVPDESSREGAQHALPLQGEANDTRLWLALILFGFFLGLAALAKGPAGYILCARRNPDFFRIFIIEHNFKRFLTPEFQHIQPFWFYVPVLFVALLPWTALVVAPVVDARGFLKKGSPNQALNLLFISYALFTVLFFSVSRSKLPGYILPVVFPLGLFLSHAVSLRVRNIVPGVRWMAMASTVTLVCLSLGILFASDTLPVAIDYFPPQPLLWVALADFVAAMAAFVLILRKRPRSSLIIAVASVLLTFFCSLTGDFAWALDLGTSPRWAARPPEDVSINYWSSHAATYRLNRSFQYGLAFYFHHELPEWAEGTTERDWVFTTPRQMSELRGMGLRCSHFMAFPPMIVCEAPALAANPPGSRQPQ